MRIALFSLGLLLASPSFSAPTPEGLPAFGAVSFSQLRSAKSPLLLPKARFTDVITDDSMLVQGGKSSLFGYAQTNEQFQKAAAYWTEILKGAGISPGAPTFVDGRYEIPYTTSDGRVLRDFLADPDQFPPKDDAGLRANMALVQSALGKAGLNVISAHVVHSDVILPTYSLLYLTRSDDNGEHEVRARVLKPGDEMDFDVYRGAGVDVVQAPKPWMMVYIGPEMGFVSMAAKTREEAGQRMAKRKEFLLSEGKRLIAERITSLDDDEYKFAASIYFFQ